MTYKELLPVDKPPFPFAKLGNGTFPVGAYPSGVLSFDALMQAYYIAVLLAAQKIDAGATISSDIGMVVVTMPDGQNLMLTGGLYTENSQGLATVEKQLERAGITPPAVIVAPRHDPDPAENIAPFFENGRWVRYNLFGIKVACKAPKGAPVPLTGDVVVAKILTYIEGELAAEPPKEVLSDDAVKALEGVYGFAIALKG